MSTNKPQTAPPAPSTQTKPRVSDPASLPRFVRAKGTQVDETLPPAAELIGDGQPIFNYVDLDHNWQKLAYAELAHRDPQPIPMPVDREDYGTVENSAHFWATGHGDWLNVCEAIERFHDSPQQPKRLLDFGCATGRFLRHVWAFGEQRFEPWGCDFAPANVNWSKRYLSPDIKIFLNNDVPHLPFADGYFDVVTAFSVLTHIDLAEDAWLLELRRVTSPNGLLYLTIQNEATWSRVIDRPGSLQHMQRANSVAGNMEITEELLKGPLPQDRIVLRMSNSDIYNCNVWHSNDYIKRQWGRYFDVLHIADNGHSGYQSPVILRPHEERHFNAPAKPR